MITFSANLGFLWQELALPEAIHRAKRAGFDAVECHWPYDFAPEAVKDALDQTGLKMLGLNTIKGGRPNDMGLAAKPDRQDEARAAIDQAIDYARKIDALSVHVMAGTQAGHRFEECEATFVGNLQYACDRAQGHGLTILIEPLNPYDNPDYFLLDLNLARKLVQKVERANLKIMFDCYHLQITGGDLLRRFKMVQDMVGHVQFAGVPDRGRPDRGEVSYEWLLPAMRDAGFQTPFGAEYRPNGDTESTLDWMDAFRR